MSQRLHRPPRRGITLIEVIVALAILSGALLGLGSFVTRFQRSTTDNTTATTASDLVVDRLEQIKAWGKYANLETTFATTETLPQYPGYTRQTWIQHVQTTSTDYKVVTVAVTHASLPAPVKKSTIISVF